MKKNTSTDYEDLLLRLQILEEKVYKDSLTNLYNRRLYDERLFLPTQQECMPKTIAFIMADVEQFKHINDCYGHIIGDVCLRKIAQVFSKNTFPDDYVIRYGGDEFLLILKNRNHTQINDMITVLKKQISEIRLLKYPAIQIHVNMGYAISAFTENTDDFFSMLLKEADQNMYEEKMKRRKH